MASSAFVPPVDPSSLRDVARVRILYADTDKLGIGYHGAYLRYLELGRVELIRGIGLPYTELEDLGLALPVVDLGVHYRAPALYDDHVTIAVGIARVTRVRVDFAYQLRVDVGDRVGADRRVEVLTAVTRHACIRVATGKPERLPGGVVERLGSWDSA